MIVGASKVTVDADGCFKIPLPWSVIYKLHIEHKESLAIDVIGASVILRRIY